MSTGQFRASHVKQMVMDLFLNIYPQLVNVDRCFIQKSRYYSILKKTTRFLQPINITIRPQSLTNYDDYGKQIARPRTLLIDSEQLESGDVPWTITFPKWQMAMTTC